MRTVRRRRARRLRRLVVLVVVLAALVAAGWWAVGRFLGAGPLPFVTRCTATAGGTSTSVAPDQAVNAATIAGIAVRRGLPARAATIALATAIQESKLRNLSGGDRDSVGLFQQRPSQGWGSVAQLRDTVYATNAFYDVLVKIEGYRDLPITEVAQRVQRSGFPQAYADHEAEARILASALTGQSPAALGCRLPDVPSALAVEAPTASGLTPRAQQVADAAKKQLPAVTATPAAAAAPGTALQITARDRTPTMGWVLAHWAVARAGTDESMQVQVTNRVWRRADGPDWHPAGTALPVGVVLVTVAPGG